MVVSTNCSNNFLKAEQMSSYPNSPPIRKLLKEKTFESDICVWETMEFTARSTWVICLQSSCLSAVYKHRTNILKTKIVGLKWSHKNVHNKFSWRSQLFQRVAFWVAWASNIFLSFVSLHWMKRILISFVSDAFGWMSEAEWWRERRWNWNFLNIIRAFFE